MLKAIRMGLTYDVARLVHDLTVAESVKNDWMQQTVIDKTDFHKNWTILALRSRGGSINDDGSIWTNSIESFLDTPILARTPYFKEVLSSIPCKLMSARLSSLLPGGSIGEHEDSGLKRPGSARLHVPICTNDQVQFVIGGREVKCLPGELWWGNFGLAHSVKNCGVTRRVHLLIDAVVNEELINLVPDEMREEVKDVERFLSDRRQAKDAAKGVLRLPCSFVLREPDSSIFLQRLREGKAPEAIVKSATFLLSARWCIEESGGNYLALVGDYQFPLEVDEMNGSDVLLSFDRLPIMNLQLGRDGTATMIIRYSDQVIPLSTVPSG